MNFRKFFTLLAPLAAMLIGLPLAGVALTGNSVSPYLAFPPVTTFVAHAPFSWGAFLALTALVLVCVTPFVYRLARSNRPAREAPVEPRPLAWWGWLGVAVAALAWGLAWNRFSWFAPFQEYTFTPIWLGYVLVVNALTSRRSGQCLLTERPGYLLALFALSAAFWWFFEYLNRFVQNWHYVGVAELGAWEYFWQATLPFSTVLPAVLSTRDYLASFPRLSDGLRRAWAIRLRAPRRLAAVTLLVAGLGLAGIGVWPEHLYPLLWIAPLLVIVSLQVLRGEPTVFQPLGDGDWRGVWLAALAALVCGFFWELWNYKSLAHWEYSIAYVGRFEIFHMPLLGYAGYLPFGVACIAVAGLLDRVFTSG
jgi:hypothetical protein